jgi:hypothetical protein
MDDPAFQRGEIDVTYVDRFGLAGRAREVPAALIRPLAVAAALLAEQQRTRVEPATSIARPPDRLSAWAAMALREGLRE